MRSSDLVEREPEIASLHALLAETGAGLGRVALIEGPAGIGKTRLLAELREHAARTGVLVLSARGSDLEREFPFGVVRQLFEARVADPAERDRLLAGAAASAAPVFAGMEEGRDGDAGGDASFAALHGLFWLALNLAGERPVMLAIDDLHWCDVPSLRFIAYLVRRLEGLPILVATTWRNTDPGADPALLAEIAQDPTVVSVRPGPLSEAAACALVRDRLGADAAPEFCTACHGATGGNPLLLGQLLTALKADGVPPTADQVRVVRDVGPRAVSRTVLLRLARLSADAIAVARAVAVLGDGADLLAVAALADVPEVRVGEAVGALARAEILRPDPPMGFVHPLVRDAVYLELPPPERELQHTRAAKLLVEAGASADQVAAHLLVMPRRGEAWVVEWLQEAGRAAARRGASDSAAAYLTRALEEPPAPDVNASVQLELGLSQSMRHADAAVEHLRAAHAQLRDPLSRGLAAAQLAQALIFSGAPRDAARLAHETAAELPAELSDLVDALEAIELMTSFFGQEHPDRVRRLREYRTHRFGDGPGAKMLAAVTAFDWAVTDGSVDECVALAKESLEDGTLIQADNGFVVVAAAGVLFLADRDEVVDVWDQVAVKAHRSGSLFAASGMNLWSGYTMLRRGELAEAEALMGKGLAELRLFTQSEVSRLYNAGFMAAVKYEQGDLDAAWHELGDSPVLTSAEFDAARHWLRAKTALLTASDRLDEALELSEEYGRRAGRLENPAWAPWRSLRALVLNRLGRTEEAIELVSEELVLARRWGAPGTVGRTLRILGLIEREKGLDHLREAVETLEASPARLELAKALGAFGGALRRARQPSEAREPLRRALELADVCGATRLAEQLRTELYASGARPRTTALSGAGALTASERRVADLAASGQSNRDIAQVLFVTPKTVEVHLSNTYRKLGIRSRRELPVALGA